MASAEGHTRLKCNVISHNKMYKDTNADVLILHLRYFIVTKAGVLNSVSLKAVFVNMSKYKSYLSQCNLVHIKLRLTKRIKKRKPG